MNNFNNINIKDFDYELPDDRIAKYPLEQRDASRLLVFARKNIIEDDFLNVSEYIPDNSLILFNDTKVINARLVFNKRTGGKIEIFCLEPIDPSDYYQSFNATEKCIWKCLVGNNKKWKEGKLTKELDINGKNVNVEVTKLRSTGNSFEILFEWNCNEITFSDILETAGNIPVPPYLNRDTEDLDRSRYQTIYGKYQGSVAAPTAGLHFTDNVFDKLKDKNIISDSVTLHVGAGTFHPVKTDDVSRHEMHTEYFRINKSTIDNIIEFFGNITIVGTTTVRTVESTFQAALHVFNDPSIKGNNFFISQFEVYDVKNEDVPPYIEILRNLSSWMYKNGHNYIDCATQIMILPGYKFKITDRLITNFHQPKSTLLLLLAAFIGNEWKRVYDYALDNGFRFLSYGDSSIFIR